MYWDRCSREEKVSVKNRFLHDLETEGNLALLLIHALIGEPAKQHFVGGVVRIDGDADASGYVESIRMVLADVLRQKINRFPGELLMIEQ